MIYFILNVSNNTVKIGTTTQLANRLSTLQTATSEKLVLLHTTSKYSEKDLHKLFANQKVSGEWFTFDLELRQWLNTEKIIELDEEVVTNNNVKNKKEPIVIDNSIILTQFLLKNSNLYNKYMKEYKVKHGNLLCIVINNDFYRVATDVDIMTPQINLMLYENVEINDIGVLKAGLINYLDIKNKTPRKHMVEISQQEWFERSHTLIERRNGYSTYREHEFK